MAKTKTAGLFWLQTLKCKEVPKNARSIENPIEAKKKVEVYAGHQPACI